MLRVVLWPKMSRGKFKFGLEFEYKLPASLYLLEHPP
jgi:hypothetical protein